MVEKYICIAGKNSIAIAGLSYLITNYSQKATLLALCDDNDTGMDAWQPSFKKFAKKNNVQLVDLETLYQIENLCFISLEYFRLLDPKKFKTKNLFNIHFSLLPAYRGMYTSAHPILNGESEAGCTFHRIDSGIDTGEIISQVCFKLTGEENCKDLYWKYLLHGRELTFNTVDALIENNFQCKIQPNANSSYYSKKSIDYSNLSVDFNMTAEDVSKQLRAYTFRDFQLPIVNGVRIFGHDVTDNPSSQLPGDILETSNEFLRVATCDFDLKLYLDTFPSLIEAVYKNDKGRVSKALSSNPHVIDENDNRGWTALIVSSFNGYNDITELLLGAGADPTRPNPKGTVPLMYAKENALRTGNFFGLKILLEYGADKNVQDIYQKTIYDYLDSSSKHYSDVCAILS